MLRKLKNGINILLYGAPILKQQLLLQKALQEEGFKIADLEITIDHNFGVNYVNGIPFGIKYPKSFLLKSQRLANLYRSKRDFHFYFNGFMNLEGGRQKLLEPFMLMPNSKIISSNEGRVNRRKNRFNTKYFDGLANSYLGLCPHQLNWTGDTKALWTYRFIECCFVNTIPVIFKETPLCKEFINNISFYWADEALKLDFNNLSWYLEVSKENYLIAKDSFCFNESELEQIKFTL